MAEPLTQFIDNPPSWPFLPVLTRLAMAVGMGVFIGLEREHSQKTGVRTFALTAVLGCLGGMMGTPYAAISTAFFALAAVGMSYRQMVLQKRLGLTTAAALVIVGFTGILFGQGHIFTPAVVGILTAALLAWKEPISRFAVGLTDPELRAAILLAILTFVVLPVLPSHPIDPWGLVQPRENWISVILIAGIGFINYILLRLLGPRGMEVTAFFGGLVNSRKVIVELATRLREMGDALVPVVQNGVLLATGAMIIRNGLIVGVLDPGILTRCVVPLVAMLAVNTWLWLAAVRSAHAAAPEGAPGGAGTIAGLESPFKLSAALKFGAVFLALNVIGALAQRRFGSGSFYFVSIAGGLLSSGSSIASAATLAAHREISTVTGANGVVLSSLTSILANLPLIRGLIPNPEIKRKMAVALWLVAGVGVAALVANMLIWKYLL